MQPDHQQISQLSKQLYKASKSIRILRHISWPPQVRDAFFANNAQKLPSVEYPKFDPSNTLEQLTAIQPELDALTGHEAQPWLQRQAKALETSAHILANSGTRAFFDYSQQLYGTPNTPLTDGMATSLTLAKQFDSLIESFATIDLGAPDDACHLAENVAQQMRQAVSDAFGDSAPAVLIEDNLSANALAGAKRIRIKRTACFTDRDIVQLINHEAYIHVGTSLNGLAQTELPMLAASHPGTTRTQEGLAVFAEFITGTMDIDRMRRLSDRVLGIQMAIDGADFIEVYRYFLKHVENTEQAFENTRRVFRGGVLTGGAPFTKDNVYLDGLVRVHNFFRAIVATKRVDCLPLLFCGKLDLEDIPMLCNLANDGLLKMPKYLPPWATDKRFLLSYLAYSSFLNGIDMSKVKNHYNSLLENTPLVKP